MTKHQMTFADPEHGPFIRQHDREGKDVGLGRVDLEVYPQAIR